MLKESDLMDLVSELNLSDEYVDAIPNLLSSIRTLSTLYKKYVSADLPFKDIRNRMEALSSIGKKKIEENYKDNVEQLDWISSNIDCYVNEVLRTYGITRFISCAE